MNSTLKLCACLGALLCLLAVAIGAFGAHALRGVLEANQRVDVFDLANRYQFYHGLAMLALSAVMSPLNVRKNTTLIVCLFVAGTLIFSGSLYLLAIINVSWLGAVTPVGGILLIAAWSLSLHRLLSL